MHQESSYYPSFILIVEKKKNNLKQKFVRAAWTNCAGPMDQNLLLFLCMNSNFAIPAFPNSVIELFRDTCTEKL